MAAVALVVLVVLAGCSLGFDPGGTDAEPGDSTEPPNAAELGHYDGYWYNDTLDVDASDGLDEAEQEAVFSRAMARVQLLRGLKFEEDVEFELVTRETFREEYGNVTTATPPEDVRTLDNAQFEVLFLVPGDRDVVEVRQGNRGDLVLGFYQPGPGKITLVGESDPATLPDERTLAHELVHALQDQRFELPAVQGKTLDRANAQGGLVEGGATVVAREYERNCETGEWECTGVGADANRPAPQPGFHYGVYFVDFFPYAEGPTFVAHHRNRRGWDAVDAMYDDLPNASAEVIYPATYDTDAYGSATVEDRNADEWERVRSDRGSHATVGQSGLASMFAYTAYTDRGTGEGVVDPREFENLDDDGRLDQLRPFTYDLAYAEGWYGDRLHAYENGGETATVWNVTFNDEANATQFVSGYEQVIEFWGGERSGSQRGGTVWTLEGDGFDGVVWVERDGDSVTVVKAPDAEDAGDVYAPAGSQSGPPSLAARPGRDNA
jgi:hypothetical protein